MVRCSGIKLMASLKKRTKPLKKKEPIILEEAEVIPVVPLNSAIVEVPDVLAESHGEAEVVMETTEVQGAAEAPIEQGSPLCATEAS